MGNIFREVLDKELGIEEISDEKLIAILDEVGKDAVYNYLLYGKDYTYDMFLKNFCRYLQLYRYVK